MRYLVDTNTVIAWVRAADRRVVARFSHARASLALPSIVFYELQFGAFNSEQVERNLAVYAGLNLPILPFEAEDARAAGEIRARLKQAGTPIGPYDLLIAGQALARDLTLVTNNIREFARVDGLKLEDWTA